MNPKLAIARNFAWCDEYEDSSFTGLLHEKQYWSMAEYWELEWALYQLVGNRSPEVQWRIFRIFSWVLLTIGCHFDKKDLYKIKNLKRHQLYELRERFVLVFEGFFSGKMPSQECFENTNPLVTGT
ncbi:immunity protein 41 of polymorphic toxin system [Ectopseudomonas oleovorans]|uniref:Immunity protein 41 of polymorphic toxin system n=1 Tax=Ectopseudomonas oleovorans TaxID=301 RepID=A0A397N7A1_ECTOL|nr:immunity protein 41 of polymorphic toxin system [Pseudomonas oleovorans]